MEVSSAGDSRILKNHWLRIKVRSLVKLLLSYTYKPLLEIYLAKPRDYKHNGIKLTIPPGVFHPKFFFSTQFLIEFLSNKNIQGFEVLELGAGSGIISCMLSKNNNKVTASDISYLAVKALHNNLKVNNINVDVVHSDLFDFMPVKKFDVVIINPPYYKHAPKSDSEYAWYCGENLEYFQKLFLQIHFFLSAKAVIWMVLSEDCDIIEIKRLAAENDFSMELIAKKSYLLEMNFIYQIRLNQLNKPTGSNSKHKH